jgi:hypothetical protein
VVCAEEQATYEKSKRAKRAAELSRLLTMISDHSSVSVERQELMALVQKGFSQYEDRLEVATQQEAARAAVAEDASPFDSDAAKEEPTEASGEEEAQLTNAIADQVSARVDKMLQSAAKDMEAVEKKIGGKLRVLDADCDGKITMSELLKVREAFGADTLSEADEIEMVNILSGLIKADGSIAVEDLRKLTGDIIATEHNQDEDQDEDEDENRDKDRDKDQEALPSSNASKSSP